MEIISGIIDFSGLKITFPRINEEQKFICYTDKNTVLYSAISADSDTIFFLKNNEVYIYMENISVIHRPESIIFKTTNSRLYYTFIGSCLVFSTDKAFVQTFDTDSKNTVSISSDSYGKFSKDGLEIY